MTGRRASVPGEPWPSPTRIGWRGTSLQRGRMDAMGHLRRIEGDKSVPVSIRHAAERLTTTVTRRGSDSFTTDPIGDARMIIAYLAAT